VTATGHRRPEGVDLTVDGTIRQSRREWRQAWRCPGRATLPALCGVSLIREIREIRGPFFAGSRVGHASWARRAAPQPSGFAVGTVGPQTTQKDAERGVSGLRLGAHRLRAPGGGSLGEACFVAAVSRSIAIHRD